MVFSWLRPELKRPKMSIFRSHTRNVLHRLHASEHIWCPFRVRKTADSSLILAARGPDYKCPTYFVSKITRNEVRGPLDTNESRKVDFHRILRGRFGYLSSCPGSQVARNRDFEPIYNFSAPETMKMSTFSILLPNPRRRCRKFLSHRVREGRLG